MLKRKFGWTDVMVPVIGQGTWMIEGDLNTERLAVGALRLGLDLGLTHIDHHPTRRGFVERTNSWRNRFRKLLDMKRKQRTTMD